VRFYTVTPRKTQSAWPNAPYDDLFYDVHRHQVDGELKSKDCGAGQDRWENSPTCHVVRKADPAKGGKI